MLRVILILYYVIYLFVHYVRKSYIWFNLMIIYLSRIFQQIIFKLTSNLMDSF